MGDRERLKDVIDALRFNTKEFSRNPESLYRQSSKTIIYP